MDNSVIAIICDCDGTLCPDTSDKLVSSLGLDSEKFWRREVHGLVQDGWDPSLAYLSRLLEASRRLEAPINGKRLRDVARSVEFYQGSLDFVARLRRRLQGNVEYRQAGITVEWFVVTSGIEDLLRETPLGQTATELFGCAFHYDSEGSAIAVKRAVSFTEKTKFLFAVNKGISGEELRRNPYVVNDAARDEDRPVPFEYMVYIGDGPSDIPCFSMVKKLGGEAIGVMPPGGRDLKKPYELARGQRLTVGPYSADYTDGSDLYRMLWTIVESKANSMLVKRAHRMRPSPGY
jgi:hypothetical protein